MVSNRICTILTSRLLASIAVLAAMVVPAQTAISESVFFNIATQSAAGPPYPTENVVVDLLEIEGTGGLEHTVTMLLSAGVVSDKATPKLLEAAVKGQNAGQEFVQFDLLYDGDGTDLQPDSFFDITYRIAFQGQPGTTPEMSVSDFLESDGSLVASVNIGGHKAGGGGTGVGRVGGKMHLEDISLGIISSSVNHLGVDPFFDIAFRLHLVDPAQIPPNQSLARLTFTAQSVPEPNSMTLVGVAVCGLVGIVAHRRRGSTSLQHGAAFYLALVIVTVAGASTANAAVIVSTMGSTVHPTTSSSIFGNIFTAAEFTTDNNAYDFTNALAKLNMFTPGTFNAVLHHDNAGLPGATAVAMNSVTLALGSM